jgi:hypothetical protein
MSFHFEEFAKQVAAGAAITARDTLALRQWAWRDGVVSPEEVDGLFHLNALGKSSDPAWIDCFVEAVGDYLVHQRAPVGYVDEDNAAWLRAQIDHDGRVDTLAELELLVRLAERAINMPDSLKRYTLEQIEAAVLTGTGPTRSGEDIVPGRIDAAEVKLLRRLLFAPGSLGPASISGEEAELLFRLKDATLGADNAPDWQQLFVQGVANYLLAFSRGGIVDIAKAQRLEAFMDQNQARLGGFLSRMNMADGLREIGRVFRPQVAADEPSHEAKVANAARLDAAEASWLKGQMAHDGVSDPLEAALLAFIERETGARP